MKYLLKLLLLTFFFQNIAAQNKSLWKGYFSYNNVKDISQSDDKIFGACENSFFYKNLNTNEIKTVNTIDGLPSENISSIYFSKKFNKTLVGYENGLLAVVNEADGTVKKVFDILNKQLPESQKKVNHFSEYNDIAYVSCNFGIVQFNLKTLLFGDTYFIGKLTPDVGVYKTAIVKDYIYAATKTEGLKRALVNNTNLIDVNQWDTVLQDIVSVISFNDTVFAINTLGQLSKSSDGVAFSNIDGPYPGVINMSATDKNLIITTPNTVNIYDTQLGIPVKINKTAFTAINTSASFTNATVINDNVFIGTNKSGIINTKLSNLTFFENILPNGPTQNDIFSINAKTSNLWAVYGKHDQQFNPQGFLSGFSKYNNQTGWLNIGSDQVDNAIDLVAVTVNPSNENQIYISSYFNGLLKYENEKLVTRYDYKNSGLESLVLPSNPNYKSVRIAETAFDKDGNLWLTNDLIENSLKVLKKDGKWQSYKTANILPDFFNTRFGKMVIDKNGTKWIASITDGVIAFNEKYNNKFLKIEAGSGNGNLPGSAEVQAIAVDNKNQLWIGTREGLRIVNNVDSFITDNKIETKSIIILDDNLAQELLYQQYITDIEVDGANNKWIATQTGGVFFVSANGQETFKKFTTSNSPLPNNYVVDIDINPKTGEVFFVTLTGMISYQGTATSSRENLDNVVVFPNPVRPEFTGTVKISGLSDKADVKITDIEGNLVFENISDGGTIEWDTTAFGKYKVTSGVYIILIAGKDGSETTIRKVMIIR